MLNVNKFQAYPNRCGKRPADDNRGALRVGIVEDNTDTHSRGLAGHMAAVTHEFNGEARFYIFTATPADSLFPNIPMWVGPYQAYSEEILDLNQESKDYIDALEVIE